MTSADKELLGVLIKHYKDEYSRLGVLIETLEGLSSAPAMPSQSDESNERTPGPKGLGVSSIKFDEEPERIDSGDIIRQRLANLGIKG